MALLNTASHRQAIVTLSVSFAIWKTLLLAIAAASPGRGYDTSTQILLQPTLAQSGPSSKLTLVLTSVIDHLVSKLVRWDAFYYVSTAQRGYAAFEQEWAFGWGMTQLLHRVTAACPYFSVLNDRVKHALIAISISHISHLISVITLYALVTQILWASNEANPVRRIALTSSLLHIFSPAGLFLSAPYAESLFSTCQFLGMLACVLAWQPSSSLGRRFLLLCSSGVCFGAACLLRSNGIFSGLLFVEPFLLALQSLSAGRQISRSILQLAALCIAGLLTLAGLIMPQYLAYHEYCIQPSTAKSTRPWCNATVPSIYTFVQSHYWGVGFLKYWTLSNIPLFLVAAPMLIILLRTALIAIFDPQTCLIGTTAQPGSKGLTKDAQLQHGMRCLRRLALPQVALAVLATTNFHVQIVNRLSSAYPIWYMVLAMAIHNPRSCEARSTKEPMRPKVISRLFGDLPSEWIVRGMVMYAIIQGGLYASFLPPA